jgi:hypothetical protein
MYVNGKMRPVDTILVMGNGALKIPEREKQIKNLAKWEKSMNVEFLNLLKSP